MSVRPYRDIYRRTSRQIRVGAMAVGGDALISVQSMTNTLTTDVKATIEQIHAMEEAGVDIVRMTRSFRRSLQTRGITVMRC